MIDERTDRTQRRGYALMDSIEAHGPPTSVKMIHTYRTTRGGFEAGIILFGLLGLFFLSVPLFFFGVAVATTPSDAEPIYESLAGVLIMVLFTGVGFLMGFSSVKELVEHLWRPPPIEDIELKIWFDSAKRFLAKILHPTDQKTGARRSPELIDGCFVMPTYSVKVQSGADGWQGEGAYSFVVVGNSSHRFIIDSNAWGEEAEHLAKAIALRTGIPYQA